MDWFLYSAAVWVITDLIGGLIGVAYPLLARYSRKKSVSLNGISYQERSFTRLLRERKR